MKFEYKPGQFFWFQDAQEKKSFQEEADDRGVALSQVIQECAQLCKPGGHLFFSTINRNLKSFIFAILGAEYILNILPQGTHEFEKLIKPSEMKDYIDRASLVFEEVKGMSYLPFLDIVRLTDDPSVNYIIHATKK